MYKKDILLIYIDTTGIKIKKDAKEKQQRSKY